MTTSPTRTAVRQPDPVDVHVGHRLRIRRVVLGLDQRQLGAAVGVSPQQIQKYERGGNRISASRLYDIARALDVPVEYFFRGLSVGPRIDPTALPPPIDVEGRRVDSLALVEAFWSLPDAEHRHRVLDLVALLGRQR